MDLITDAMKGQKMKNITIEQFMERQPCHIRDKIAVMFNGRSQVTAVDILELPISDGEKGWVLSDSRLYEDDDRWLILASLAEQVVGYFDPLDEDYRSFNAAIEITRIDGIDGSGEECVWYDSILREIIEIGSNLKRQKLIRLHDCKTNKEANLKIFADRMDVFAPYFSGL